MGLGRVVAGAAAGLIMLGVSFGAAPSAWAGTTGWSGTLGADPILALASTGSTCLPPGTNGRAYHVQPFTVSESGSYDLSIVSAAGMPVDALDTMHAVYENSFDPANWTLNCIAYNDDNGAGVLSITADVPLVAGTQYFVVVMNAWVGMPVGATFSGEITGPGTISTGLGTGSGTPVPEWVQGYGRGSASDACRDGWSASWALWPNDGTGGWVCTRTVPSLG